MFICILMKNKVFQTKNLETMLCTIHFRLRSVLRINICTWDEIKQKMSKLSLPILIVPPRLSSYDGPCVVVIFFY